MAVLKDYYNINDNDACMFQGDFWEAQTFKASSSYDIEAVKLKLYKTSSPGEITVGIRNIDGSGHPIAPDLCSGTTDGNTLPLSPDDILHQSNSTGGNGFTLACSGCQTFTPEESHTLSRLDLRLKRPASPAAGTGTINLYAVDGEHKPTGEPLLSIGSFSIYDLTTSYAWYSFTDLSYSLVADIEYAIVIVMSGDSVCQTGELTDSVCFWDAKIGGYARGVGWHKVCALNGEWACQAYWSVPPGGADHCFREYSAGDAPEWREITFSEPASLVEGTTYAIVARTAGYTGEVWWRAELGDGTGYPDGNRERGVYGTWYTNTQYDYMFETYGAGDPPGVPINPAPTVDEEDVDLYLPKLNWESGSEPDAPLEVYDVWFSLIGDTLVKIGSSIEETEFPLSSTLFGLSNYHWRIDATNEFGTTTGDVWYFSTLIFGGYIRIGFSLAKDKAEGEGMDFHSDIIVDEFLYTSGMGHISETLTFDTVRKVNPGTGAIIWSTLPLGSSQFPGKLCSKGDYLYAAGPTYPVKIDKSDGIIIKTYNNIFGGNGVAVDYNNQIFSCGQIQGGKNIWRSNDAGDSEVSVVIGSGTLYDVQIIRIDGVDYIFVCGDYDPGQNCDVWKLDTNLNILSTYRSGGNSNRIIRAETENFLFVLHTIADDGSGVQCHITALNFSLVVQSRILLGIDKQYEDFDRIQISTPHLYDSYVDNIDFQKFVRWIDTTHVWFAQTFTPNIGYDISSIILKLYRIDTPATGAVTISVRATDINGKPTGPDLCSGIIDGDAVTVNSEGEEITVFIDFSHTLVANTKYAIILKSPEIEHAYIGWKIDKADAVYLGGSTFVSYDGGSTWVADPVEGNGDFYFKTYGFL